MTGLWYRHYRFRKGPKKKKKKEDEESWSTTLLDQSWHEWHCCFNAIVVLLGYLFLFSRNAGAKLGDIDG